MSTAIASIMDEPHYGVRLCPSCQSDTLRQAVVCSKPRAENIPFTQLLTQWGKDIFTHKSFFSYGRCTSCGLLYCPAYPDDHRLQQLYGGMSPNMAELPEECLRSTQRAYLQTALRHEPPAGDVIEIGPDRGLLAYELARNQQFHKFWFIEPNKLIHSQLQEAVQPKECHISEDLNRYDHIPDNTASLAVMVHVLDHLTHPLHHLKQIHRCLKPGGVLSIVVHNERSLLARCFGSRFPIYCPYHPQLFNPRTLATALENAGFLNSTISRTVNFYPVGYLAKNAAFRVGFDGSWIPMMRATVMPLRLGNIQAVATK